MNINDDNIHQYLDSFFEGETTREEELALSAYFRDHDIFPGDIGNYKPMFAWIDEGMPELPRHDSKRLIPTIITWSLTAAAAISVLIVALFYTTFQPPVSDPEILYAGSYICDNNGINGDINSILPEIRATIDEVNEMEARIEILDFDNEAFAIYL